jgi:Phage protein Gp138 N-terminal domain
MVGSSAIGYGFQDPTTSGSEFNLLSFVVNQALSRVRTITPVKVIHVNVPSAVSAVGTVDVQVAINQLDGLGNSTKHGTTFGLAYFRLQGGNSAIIADPVVGDVGLALICDRDISALKQNSDISNPGSYRRFDLADGVYLGKILGQVPNFFLGFDATNGITVTTNGTAGATAGSNAAAAGGVNLVFSDSTTGQMVSIGPNGITIKAKQKVTLVDQDNNTVTVGPTGITVVDQSGNTISLGSGGISITTSGTVSISGNIAVTGNITATGSITAGQGGADQVGVQTHQHSGVTTGAGQSGSPVAGT